MGKSFWTSWQLWQKMCFVLGAAIVIVLAVGCGKVLYSRWRLRKYTALAVAKEAHRKEMERVGSTRRRKGPEVPFGIRAIESGIEVDGVWISRSNTPAPSVPASPASAASIAPRPTLQKHEDSADRSSTASNISRLDIPQPAHAYPGVNLRPSGPSSVIRDKSPKILMSTDNLHIPPVSDPSDVARAQQIRPTYRPRHSSQLRYSNSHDYDEEDRAAAAAPESHRLASDRKTSDETEDSKTPRASRSSLGSAGTEGRLSHKQSELDSASEFSFRIAPHDVLDQRRIGGLDETGFEVPTEYRNPEVEQAALPVPQIMLTGANNDWSASAHPAEHKYYATEPPTPLHKPDDPFTTPKKNPVEMQQIRAFKDIENSDPLQKSESSQANFEHRLFQAVDPNRPTRESQIIRKINSGFEILRPGTLDRPPPSVDTKSKREADDEKQMSRKLQRKTRDPGHSRESKFIERT